MKVISLFNGYGSIWLALDKLGIEVTKRFSCEIDPYANKINDKNYPDTIQLGDIREVRYSNGVLYHGKPTKETNYDKCYIGDIDLLVGGSPCQSFSRIGDGSGFDGKSKLFWEYVRVLKECKPKWFLLENVVMKKEWQDAITEALGVEPIKINSKHFSAQNRNRLYWTNIPVKEVTFTSNRVIRDILEKDAKFTLEYPDYLNGDYCGRIRKDMVKLIGEKASCLTASMYKGQIASYCKNSLGEIHKYTPIECERLQTVPDNYTEGVSNTQRYKMLGNGWTVDVIVHLLKNIAL